MKKQKKPLILIVFLTLLVGGAAYFNTPKNESAPPPPAAPTKDTSTQSVATNVAANIDKSSKKTETKPKSPSKPGPAGPGNMKEGMGRPDNVSTLVRPTMGRMQKPKPSTTSTATQWYTPEANNK